MMLKGKDFVRRKINEIRAKSDATAKEDDLLTTLEAVYEFYMRGFEFAPMDLYECDATKFLVVDEKRLRPPFVAISGLGAAAANDLMIEDGLVTKRNITTGISSEDYVEITDGIKEGEEVIADLGKFKKILHKEAVNLL